MKALRRTTILVALGLVFGCGNQQRVYSHTAKQATMSNLQCLAVAVMDIDYFDKTWRAQLFDKSMTSEKLLEEIVRREKLSIEEASGFTIDLWGSSVQIGISKQDRLVSFISAGPNEVFENGQGDDIRVEVHFPGVSPAYAFHRWLLDNGQEHSFYLKYPK